MKYINPLAFSPDSNPAISTTRSGLPGLKNPPENTDLTPMVPTRLFDNFYFVGTRSVGTFLIETEDGLIMLDTGWNEKDCAIFVSDMQKMGLDPHNIKLILISHEHIDHYGGTQYLKNNICPEAKVAMSLLGWNYMMTWPTELAFDNPRPKSIDIFLHDGDIIKQGQTEIQVVATPGHSPGCLSFIIPISDRNESHAVGIMGGTAVPNNWNDALLYYCSIDYFRAFTRLSRCDIGLGTHASYLDSAMNIIRSRKPDDPNPLIIGTERFETEYLQKYRDLFFNTISKLPPNGPSIPMRPRENTNNA